MKKNLTNALLLMAALSLAGCSDNLTEGATTQVQDGKTEGCVTFKVSNIGSETRATRAEASETLNDSFNEGDPNEWAITTSKGANVAFFFGSDNKTYQGMTVPAALSCQSCRYCRSQRTLRTTMQLAATLRQ